MTASIDTFSRVVGKIYEAGLDPDLWPLALESICLELGADKAQMLYIDPKEYFFSFACGYGFDPYAHNIGAGRFRKYLACDPIAQYGIGHLDEVFSDRRVVNQKELRESSMQREIRDPADMQHLLTTFITDEARDWTGLCFFRGKNSPYFTSDDEKILTRYLPHIRRATGIHKTIAGEVNLKTIQNAVLDNLDQGIIVVDDSHNVVICNREAKRLLESTDAVKIRNNQINCKHHRENTLFKLSIDNTLSTNKIPNDELKIAVKLNGSESKSSLFAVTTKLQLHSFEEKIQGHAISAKHYTARLPLKQHALITLCNPESCKRSSNFLGDLFGLTPAESALLERLSCGESLKEAAENLGRKTTTARLQLQSVFEKTNTNRQASLIKLIMSIP